MQVGVIHPHMVDNATATVEMDEKGRLTIPQSTRRVLDIDGVSADLNLNIRVLERNEEDDDP